MTVQERRIVDQILDELLKGNYAFQEKLKSEYPDLTRYNIRLCTYLKAGLSTKEIASLLNITPDSVKKAKHRLRKKLNMSPNHNWSTYLNTHLN